MEIIESIMYTCTSSTLARSLGLVCVRRIATPVILTTTSNGHARVWDINSSISYLQEKDQEREREVVVVGGRGGRGVREALESR
jgi:hypothetical protein